MSNYFQRAVELAFKTFSARNKGVLTHDNLTELKQYVNKIRKTELNLSPSLLEDRSLSENDPPVTYVRVSSDQVMTVAVFILRPGKRLPLHDHPKMHGFLKVIHGKVNIQTYTQLDANKYQAPASLTNYLEDRYNRHIPVYPMWYEGCQTVSETDDCCVLTPEEKNIHEITADYGTAAFLDILSPPYCNDSEQSDYSPCSYYKELEQDKVEPSIKYFVKINPPSEYWCDEAPYTGPSLSGLANSVD